MVTIETAAEAWLAHLQTRRRRPIKPASAATFRSYLDKHILPRLGHLEVANVGVAALRDFISELDAAGLSPKTQVEITSCVKSIVDSVCDAEGEPLYPRKWDNDRLDLPIVSPAAQRTPTVTREQIESAIANSEEAYKSLYALAAGSGLRLGELLALKLADSGTCSYFDAANARIHVRQSVWRGALQAPKTHSAVRVVEITRDLAEFVARFVGARSGGYVFANGDPLCVSTARDHLDKAFGSRIGFHALRRYRAKMIIAGRVPSVLAKYWLGHSNHGDISDHYAHGGITADATLRREWCERVGLGFALEVNRT